MLKCPQCGYRTSKAPSLWRCPRCGHPLQLASLLEGRGWGPSPRFTLGEGKAPLLRGRMGRARIWLSLEYLNPTGSFKDLGTAAVVGHMRERGVSRGVVDSSGNSAISFSYYATAAGIEAHVAVPRDAPPGKLSLIRASGARLHFAPSRREASLLAERMVVEEGFAYAGHTLNPHFIRGVAWRVYRILKLSGLCNLPLIDMVMPLSSGSLVLGSHYAVRRISKEGGCRARARLWGVLPSCLFGEQYGGVERVLDLSGGGGCSMMDALRIPRPPRVREVVEALEEGGLVLVDDGVVERWWPWALSKGFLLEPSSSVVFAPVGEEVLGEHVLLFLTGSGLKYAGMLRGRSP